MRRLLCPRCGRKGFATRAADGAKVCAACRVPVVESRPRAPQGRRPGNPFYPEGNR